MSRRVAKFQSEDSSHFNFDDGDFDRVHNPFRRKSKVNIENEWTATFPSDPFHTQQYTYDFPQAKKSQQQRRISPTSIADAESFFDSPSRNTYYREHSSSSIHNSTHVSENIASDGRRRRGNLVTNPKIIPFVSKMSLEQSLALIFSAFGYRVNLYSDVLGLDPFQEDYSPTQLRLAYFRKGREILSTPFDGDDDLTTLTYGIQGMSTSDNGGFAAGNISKFMSTRSGIRITRTTKEQFQAVCLAFQILSDPNSRSDYDLWLRSRHHTPPHSNQKSKNHSLQYEHESNNIFFRKSSPNRMRSSRTDEHFENTDRKIQYEHESNNIFFRKSSPNRMRSSKTDEHSENTDRKTHFYVAEHEKSARFGRGEKSSLHDLSNSFSTNSSGVDSILRPSSYGARIKKNDARPSTPSRIRWNEQVEELVIMDYDAKNEHWSPSDFIVDPDIAVASPDRHESNKKGHGTSKQVGGRSRREDDISFDIPYDERPNQTSYKTKSSAVKENKIYYDDRCRNIETDLKGHGIERKKKSPKSVDNLRREDEYRRSYTRDVFDDDNEGWDCGVAKPVNKRGTAINQDKVDEEEMLNGDCGLPDAFDFATGFQVALSQYLGSVVNEMKSGLFELGKTFSDIDVHDTRMNSREHNGSNFFMDDFELDALMTVLRSEMKDNPVNDKH